MMTSLDGKILSHGWGSDPRVEKLVGKFEEAHEKIGIRAWIVGRTTMEMNFTDYEKPIFSSNKEKLDRSDFVARTDAEAFAIGIDGHGKLGWKSGEMQEDHVITILTEGVEDAYLHHLREVGVSYIFAGKESVDLVVALEKLKSLFGIGKLMLEGGGRINGSFLNEGLIDEYHQLVLPLVDGRKDTATVFEIEEGEMKADSFLFKLKEFKQIEDGVMWLTYEVG
ncbi:MAG: RibD family protein [Bacteroidetes bacterium]|nr:RibD family protein [Bacteroidota bacterium]